MMGSYVYVYYFISFDVKRYWSAYPFVCQKYNDNDYKSFLLVESFTLCIVLGTWLWIDFHGQQIKRCENLHCEEQKIRMSRQTDPSTALAPALN